MTRRAVWARTALSAPLAAILAFSGVQLWNTENNYRAEAALHASVMTYKPASGSAAAAAKPAPAPGTSDPGGAPPQTDVPDAPDVPAAAYPAYNQSIAELRRSNSDVAGWITLDGTAIDYPFARGTDNDFYLRRDIDKKAAYAGTVFMDCRCRADFSGFNTILYGHSMKNGSMFHDLTRFSDKGFFDSHTAGTIYLEELNIPFEVFAFLVLQPIDLTVFQTADGAAPFDSYVAYLRAHARYWRDINLSSGDHLLTLSTCSYEFKNARAVVIAKLGALPNSH